MNMSTSDFLIFLFCEFCLRKCVNNLDHWFCNGKCIEKEKLCDGKCPPDMPIKSLWGDGLCMDKKACISKGNFETKLCNGFCIPSIIPCNGTCLNMIEHKNRRKLFGPTTCSLVPSGNSTLFNFDKKFVLNGDPSMLLESQYDHTF